MTVVWWRGAQERLASAIERLFFVFNLRRHAMPNVYIALPSHISFPAVPVQQRQKHLNAILRSRFCSIFLFLYTLSLSSSMGNGYALMCFCSRWCVRMCVCAQSIGKIMCKCKYIERVHRVTISNMQIEYQILFLFQNFIHQQFMCTNLGCVHVYSDG